MADIHTTQIGSAQQLGDLMRKLATPPPFQIPFFEATLGFLVLVYWFATYVHFRQHALYRRKQRPAGLTDNIVTEQDFQLSQVWFYRQHTTICFTICLNICKYC